MSLITSIQNPRIKQTLRLRTRRGRERQRRIVIDGVREVARAVEAGVGLNDVFFCPPSATATAAAKRDESLGASLASLLRQLRDAGAPCWEVTPSVFAKVGYGDRTDGIVAVAAPPPADLSTWNDRATWSDRKPTLIAVLEAIEKPGNVGAILRSADAAGVDGVIVADPVTDLFNPNTIRASLGTVFSLPVCTAESRSAQSWLRQRGLRILVARVDGSVPLYDSSLRQPTAVVLGSEARGVSSRWRASDMQAVRLPMSGSVDSLNVSVTAAVIFYEAWRQRHSTADCEG